MIRIIVQCDICNKEKNYVSERYCSDLGQVAGYEFYGYWSENNKSNWILCASCMAEFNNLKVDLYKKEKQSIADFLGSHKMVEDENVNFGRQD